MLPGGSQIENLAADFNHLSRELSFYAAWSRHIESDYEFSHP
jgi:hypothetical protein